MKKSNIKNFIIISCMAFFAVCAFLTSGSISETIIELKNSINNQFFAHSANSQEV